jgi:RHS repeat-associated protein
VTSYTYDVNHNQLTETDPKGKTTTNVYDGSNHLTSTTDKRGNTTSFPTYNLQHQPTQVTDREGRVTSYTYKGTSDPGAGSVDTVTEGGNVTSYSYDSRGAVSAITYPGGAGVSMVNNFLGDPTTKTDELGRVTTIGYNNRREVVSTTAPGASGGSRTTSTSYDNKRDVATVTNPRGYATSTVYSVTHKLLTTTLPDGSVTTNHYNTDDRLDWTSNPLGQTTSFGLDGLGRTTSATDPLSRTATTTYQDDQRRTITTSPAPLNIQTKATVDERGQVVRSEDGLGNYATPGYDNNGNKITWVDRRGKTWGFTYDKEDRLKNTTTPLSRVIAQAWNSRGLLDSITEPSAQVTSFGYDNRRRLTSKTDGVGTVSYGLDNAGQLLTVTQGSAVLTRTYYGSGEVATYKNANNETISYDYDKNGNLTSLTYPAIGSVAAATVTYTYDNRDRLASMTDWAGRVTTYTWDAAGKLTSVTRPNGTKRRLSWDAAGQMLAIEERPASGAPFAIRSFGYDAAGRIVKRISYPQATTWTEPVLNAGVDDDNRLTGGILGYDADGNTLASLLPDGPWGATGSSSNASAGFTWNARNQLVSATRSNDSQTASYIYDAEGNLIQTTDSVWGTTRWIIDPNGGERSRVLAKVAPNGSVTRYVYGVGLVYEVRQDGSVRYYHYDQVGSTIALTDNTGTVTGRADYSPYGTLLSTSGELANASATPFLFVGAYGVITDPATGLHQMRARWYSSYLHRFLNEDPSGFSGGENFYAYASGSPMMMADPSGLRPKLIFASNVTNKQKRIIRHDASVALQTLRKAAAYVNRLTLREARRDATFQKWFGKTNKNRLAFVSGNFQCYVL